MSTVDYRKFSNRVCNLREAGFIGIGFLVAVVAVAAILLGIYFGTKCAEGQLSCQDGQCVAENKWCDGVQDCTAAGDDEWKCYAREFYIAFRTNETYLNSTENYEKYQKNIKASLDTLRKSVNLTVNVLRLRMVNETGHNINVTEVADLSAKMAVDSRATWQNIGKVCSPDVIQIHFSNITNAIRSPGIAEFDTHGPGVTTGVAVILSAPEGTGCRRPKVYCTIECETGVYQYSSKGCPSYPCVCIGKDDLNC